MKVRASLLSAGMAWAMFHPVHAADIRYVYDENGKLVEVVAPDGSSAQYRYDAVGNINSIKKNTATALSIAEFTPNGGPAGTAVTLYGSGFSAVAGNNTVKFNGVSALVSAANTVSLTAVVPPGATSGRVAVSNTSGSATSASDFFVAAGPAPTITAFAPAFGPLGTAVTISGSNFQTTKVENKVAFGNMVAFATSATQTTLGTTAPGGAASGKITVMTPYGNATSKADFYTIPSGVNAADIEYMGRIAVNGASQTVTINSPGKKALLIFDGLPSQYLSLLSRAGTFSNLTLLTAYKPDGSVLTAGILGNSSVHDFARLPKADTYMIVVSPGAADKGKFDLQLKSEATATLAIDGPPLTIAMGTGQNGRYTFNGTAGQTLGLGFTGASTMPAGQYVACRVYLPDGSELFNPIFSGSASNNFPRLPVTGTYAIAVDPSGTSSANASLTLSSDLPGALTADAAATTFSTARPGQNGRYTFSGSAGRKHWMALTNSTFPPWIGITVLKPDGTSLISTNLNAPSTFDIPALPANGIYTVFVDPYGTSTGKLDLQLKITPDDITGGITADGAPLQVNLSVHQNGVIAFQGAAGQTLGLGYTGVSTTPAGYNITYTVRKPDGTILKSIAFYDEGGLSLPTLPAAGRYTIELRAAANSAAGATLTLTLSSDLVSTLTADAPASTFSTARPGQNGRYTFSGSVGELRSLVLTNSTFPGWTSISVLKPDGTSLLSNAVAVANTVDLPALPAAGTYTVFIDPYGGKTGKLDIQLR